MVSIIITYHEEGFETLMECIFQVRNTVELDDYEIIVVDDNSNIPLKKIDNVTVIRNGCNIGVGRSFDRGVAIANGEYIIFMACDIRFIKNGWARKLVSEIKNNPKSLICTACVGLNREEEKNIDINIRRNKLRLYGATILMFHDKLSNPKKEESFRGILEAKWKTLNKESVDKSYEIPCILGACYGTTKEWYKYIDGFWGHKQWGTLEPYISLKSWLFGGNCLVAPHIETGHIFKDQGGHYHNISQDNIIYNKLLVATLLLNDADRYIDFLGVNTTVVRAKKMISSNINSILLKKDEYKNKIVYNIDEFANKFNIDLRKNGNTKS